MTDPHPSAAPSGTVRTAATAVLITLGLHALCTMATAAPGVLAPVASRDFGLPASQVGIMIALHYFVTMFTGLAAAPLVARFGAARVLQIASTTTALGALSCAVAGLAAAGAGPDAPPSWIFALWLLATGLLFGSGYGLINPVSSNVLFHATPPSVRALCFSIKQTAVPIGFGSAGLVIPVLLLVMRWQWVMLLLTLALVAVTLALSAAPFGVPGAGIPRGALIRWSDFSGPTRDILVNPMWRRRGMMAGAYSATQTALTAYMVSFLNLEIGLSLLAAGSVFAIAQVGGVVGRVLLGIAADLWLKPRLQLGLAGIVTALCCIGMIAITPQWPLAAITALCALFGAISFAWNGVFFAETAAIAPSGQIGRLTGGMQVFISLGAMSGPALFSLIVTLSDSYSLAYVLLAVPTLLVGIMFAMPAPASGPTSRAKP